MAIVFDSVNKRIILDSASQTASNIYSRWVDWVSLDDNSKHLPAFRAVGGDDLGSGLSIPAYYFLQNGWRIRPMEQNHRLTITGNLFVDGGGDPIVNTLGTYNVLIKLVVPVQAQGISTNGGSSSSASEIAQAVRSELSSDLGKLTGSQATMLLEMYALMGLDPSKPLVVTPTVRQAGEISQTINTVKNTGTTIRRNG